MAAWNPLEGGSGFPIISTNVLLQIWIDFIVTPWRTLESKRGKNTCKLIILITGQMFNGGEVGFKNMVLGVGKDT